MFQQLPFFLFIFFLSTSNIAAQSVKSYEKEADKALEDEDYYSAMVYLAEALTIDSSNMRIVYKYAETCRQFNAHEVAEIYYTKIAESGQVKKYPLSLLWLGKTKKSLGRYREAIDYFEKFLAIYTPDNTYEKIARKEINDCQWAMNLEPDTTIQTTITHFDKKINTPYSEFGGISEENILYYSSYRYSSKKDKHNPPRNISKNLYAKANTRGRLMPNSFNDDNILTAHTAFSAQRHRIYFNRCEYMDNGKIRCDLYYRERDNRGKWARKAIKLPKHINVPGKTTTHPTIGYDSLQQKELLFFVSDRLGGKGQLDIWYSEVGEKDFSEPKNLEYINTDEDEITPYFHSEEQMLYFSTDGRKTMGGYDIYKLPWSDEPAEPQHLGIPLNSSYNDLYYTVTKNGKKGYFSSNRPGSFYLDASNKTCCYDIYQIDYKKIEPNISDTPEIVTELPAPQPTLPQKPFVPTTLEDFLPLALYFHNDEPDRRTRRTFTRKSYEETFLPYYAMKQEYLVEYTKTLDDDQSLEAEQLIDDFFEEEVKKGYDHLFLFSDILLKRLEKGETVEIFIKGYTSPRAKTDYNLSLGKRRISSLRNHFQTYKDGIFLPYLKTNQLLITERSFGEATASTAISDDLEDLRNSVYSVGAARERRVEIVEVSGSGGKN